jgi:hypothetical protein
MGHDKTPERNRLIFFYTVLSVVTLAALGFVFDSYFVIETERLVTKNVRELPATERVELATEQRERLTSGPVPIDRAMQMLARDGRAPAVRPEPSRDLAPLEGWNAGRIKPRIPAALVPGDLDGDGEAEKEPSAEGEEPASEVAPEGAMGDTAPSPETPDAPTEEATEE